MSGHLGPAYGPQSHMSQDSCIKKPSPVTGRADWLKDETYTG